MKKDWATSGLDLHLELGRDQPGHGVRAGLESALREAVRTGRLGPGVRLPSSRALAADLGVARNTVAEAYGQLVAEGWLTAVQGSGTRVAGQAATGLPTAAHSAPAARQARAAGAPAAGQAPVIGSPGAASSVPPGPRVTPYRYSLRVGSPDLSAFPRAAWLAAARRALSAAPSEAFGYGHPQGRRELRAALAEYLARARGVRAHPDRIVVCDGFGEGLALLTRVLRARGATTLAVEEYGLPSARDTAVAAGLRLAPLPVDGHGAMADPASPASPASPAGPAGAALLTPAHQFPLGAALAPGRRTQFVEWARDTGGLIIEDDYDGEFRYDRQPVGALQALAPEHVVYAGSASKSLAPGFRLGWLVLPASLVGEVTAARELTTGPGSRLDQLTLAEFITSGGYDRHVRRSRLAYRRRRDRLAAALGREAPRVRVTGIAAGLHALCELPPGLTEDHLVARAAARGLEVEGLARYRATVSATNQATGSATNQTAGRATNQTAGRATNQTAGRATDPATDAGRGQPSRQALVIGYGSPPEHSFSGAVARLCAAFNDLA
jgi:GntR family transcriptional regulator/MocR family aminotransferase